jgi:hypothetical protein
MAATLFTPWAPWQDTRQDAQPLGRVTLATGARRGNPVGLDARHGALRRVRIHFHAGMAGPALECAVRRTAEFAGCHGKGEPLALRGGQEKPCILVTGQAGPPSRSWRGGDGGRDAEHRRGDDHQQREREAQEGRSPPPASSIRCLHVR